MNEIRREIKFKVWSNKESKFTDTKWLMFGEEGFCMAQLYSNSGRYTDEEEITVLQYTGRKDKNGVNEIYDGDIVLCSGIGNNADEKYNAEIVFCEEKAAFMLDTGCELLSFTEMSELCEIEVVGNIYEGGISNV